MLVILLRTQGHDLSGRRRSFAILAPNVILGFIRMCYWFSVGDMLCPWAGLLLVEIEGSEVSSCVVCMNINPIVKGYLREENDLRFV